MADFEQLIGNEGKRVDGETAVALSRGTGITYFGNRICPFAHRALWTAEELGLAKKWNYIHINLGATKPEWYTKVNPLCTVPSLFVDGKPVFESLVIAEYINDVSHGGMLPADPYLKDTARILIARFGDSCMGPLYDLLRNKAVHPPGCIHGKRILILMLQDPAKDAELGNTLTSRITACDALYASNKSAGGPFFLGDKLSLVEIAIIPFLERFSVTLPHHRSHDLFQGGRLPVMHTALTAARARPAFKKTTANENYFVAAYAPYAFR